MNFSVHHVPGRIRYKIPELTQDQMLTLGRVLERCDDVEHVEARPASSSLIVHYDPARTNVRRLESCIEAGLRTIPKFEAASSPLRERRDRHFRDEVVVRSVRHLGMVFGKTAFKVALEQAVRGGLSSLHKSVLARN